MQPSGADEAVNDVNRAAAPDRSAEAAPGAAFGDRSGVRPLLTDVEVAGILAVQSDTVRRWAASGELPCVRLGRLLRFRAANVDAWINTKVTPSAARSPHRRRPGAIRSVG
jgi:excisionase family DNA binding protein